MVVCLSLVLLRQFDGGHRPLVDKIEKVVKRGLYWIGLGVLSSIGFGSGLHTFVMYLGPHIASVSLAAYECGSLDFPEPPYPDEIICPDKTSLSSVVNLWTIMSKVRLEAFLWGAGTALGELPPYFLAKANRLSGNKDEDLENSELGRFEQIVKKTVDKLGFFGILAFASIPNPLFDFAGVCCGHFLVPFWTFFGATLVGKAVIKMMIQKVFVIVAFNEQHFESFLKVVQ